MGILSEVGMKANNDTLRIEQNSDCGRIAERAELQFYLLVKGKNKRGSTRWWRKRDSNPGPPP